MTALVCAYNLSAKPERLRCIGMLPWLDTKLYTEDRQKLMPALFEMRHEKHAISEFSATLRFFSAVTASAFASVRSKAEAEAGRLQLPAPIKQQTIRFGIGNPAEISKIQAMMSPKTLDGFGFQSFSRSGQVDTSLLCEPDNMAMTVNQYPGWQEILPILAQTFSSVGSGYLSEVPAIKSFGLQYVNEFRSLKEGLVSCRELFRDNRWLGSFWREHDDQWHSHSGIFLPIDDSSRYLVNANFDVNLRNKAARETRHTFAKVTIAVYLNYDLQGQKPLVVDEEGLQAAIIDNLNRAHILEKNILREIFSDEYLEMMGAQHG